MPLNVIAGGDESDSPLQGAIDMVLLDYYAPCSGQYESSESDSNNITSMILLTGDASFFEGDLITSSKNVKAIVDSFDSSSNKIKYYQTAKTGFGTFSLGDKIAGKGGKVSTVKEFVLDFGIPCSDFIVSVEESPEQMMFVFADSDEAIQAKLAAQEMMAEIEEEMARQAALDAFLQKIADEKAAAALTTAAYRDALLEKELAAFEAQLAAKLAAQEMMAEIEEEMARQAALDAFLQKIADEKAAAASSTAAYQAKRTYDERVNKIMDDLTAQLDELSISGDYKSTIADELLKEAIVKLEDEKFIGAISGEIVTVAIHDFCKINLGLSESNIELFRAALEGDYLGNVGPQVSSGTEFTKNRWEKYINCVGSKRKP